MTKNNINEFKYACRKYLNRRCGINELRAYARSIGVDAPTKKSKEALLDEIIAILVGELPPVPQSRRGAPVINNYFNPQIPQEILSLRMQYPFGDVTGDVYDIDARLTEAKANAYVLEVADPNRAELEKNGVREIFKGQLETLNGVSMLLPLDCIDSDRKLVISVELIRAYDLREGDIVTCYAEKRNSILVATTVLTVNELVADSFHRGKFDDCAVCFPKKRMNFYGGEPYGSLTAKSLQWLVPVGKGQRGLVVAESKAGKSTLLAEAAKAASKQNKNLRVLALLVDQSPENIGQFQGIIGKEELLYTTYEDDADRQVFVAEFILKRAKRYAEFGCDVLLLVDSFNALARAFNDTDASSGGKTFAGGMESKTIQYIRRYFGAARCLERGGSITILGAVSVDTGNPADDFLKAELATIANLEIFLSGDLAKRRIYPALDVYETQGKRSSAMMGSREDSFDVFLRNDYLPLFGAQGLFDLMASVSTFDELEEKAIKAVKSKKK